MRQIPTKNYKSAEDRDRLLNRDSWKVFQIMAEFVDGFQQLADISPVSYTHLTLPTIYSV